MTLRLWPRSLAGQLVLVLIAALAAAQVVTLVVFLQNRRSAIEAAAREQIIGRTAALVRLLEDTPPELQPRILDAAGSPRLLYTVSTTPAVTHTVLPPDEEAVADVVTAQFGNREVRVELGDREWRPPPATPGPGRGSRRARRRDTAPRRPAGSARAPRSHRCAFHRARRRAMVERRDAASEPHTVGVAGHGLHRLHRRGPLDRGGLLGPADHPPLSRLADAAERLGRGAAIPDLRRKDGRRCAAPRMPSTRCRRACVVSSTTAPA